MGSVVVFIFGGALPLFFWKIHPRTYLHKSLT